MKHDEFSSSHPSLEQHLLLLLRAVRDAHDPAARDELNTLLRKNAEARATMARLMVDEQALISRLRDESIAELLEPAPAAKPPLRPSTRWFAWRPLTAAAAGLVIGMFCTSMVYGFGVVRSLERVVSLVQESFESGPAPLVTGVPQQLSLWSGDYSEFVGAQQGVNPAQGKKMVRVLRSDFEGKTSTKQSIMGDLMRVIDVRPYLHEAGGGEVVITLSALFNAAPFPEAESYDGEVTLYALGQPGSTEESLLEDALAHSNGKCRSLDRDPGTWQRASARLLLPPGTERVLLKLSFRPLPVSGTNLPPLRDHVTFNGHFVDEVRASVSLRKAGPDHGNAARP